MLHTGPPLRHGVATPALLARLVASGLALNKACQNDADSFFPAYLSRFLVCFILLLAPTAWAQQAPDMTAERGRPFIRNFGPLEYGGSAAVWTIAQDTSGVIYVGDQEGVLTYDGARWTRLDAPQARSLAVSDEGVVYIGSENDLGYLEPDSLGQLRFTSLLPTLTDEQREIGYVFSVAPSREGVYFQSTERLIRWHPDGTTQVWERGDGEGFYNMWRIRGVLYVLQGDQLMHVEGDSLRTLPGIPSGMRRTLGAVPYGDDHLLLYTDAGPFVYDGVKTTLLPLTPDDYVTRNQPYHASRLPDGTFVVGTTQAGLIRHDVQGRILQVIDRDGGLNSDNVYHTFVDRAGGLWAALDNGLSHVEVLGPLTVFGDDEGLPGELDDVTRRGDALYATTGRGAYRLSPRSPGRLRAAFERVEGVTAQSFSMEGHASGLLVGTVGGLHLVRGLRSSLLSESPDLRLHLASNDSNLLFIGGVGSPSGLSRRRYDPVRGRWGAPESIDGSAEFAWGLEEGEGALWNALRSIEGLARVRAFGGPIDSVRVDLFDDDDGLPPGRIQMLRLNGDFFAYASDSLFRFDAASERFVYEDTFDGVIPEGVTALTTTFQTVGGDAWSTTRQGGDPSTLGVMRFRTQTDGTLREDTPIALRRLPPTTIWKFYGEQLDTDAPVLWMGADNGLYRYEMDRPFEPVPATPLVRRVSLNDSLLFGGTETADYRKPRLGYSRQSLRLTYALPTYDASDRTRYQVRLVGYDDAWSAWTDETQKDYTNLSEGDYAFQVRARDVYGQETTSEPFAFTVLPPWYRTLWAYLAYTLLAIGLVYAAARAWGWRLEQKNRQLEVIVAERTQEVREQASEIEQKNVENERLLLNILPGPIATRLKASDEPIADAFADVTVLFADLVGFTVLSQQVTADELVGLLNDLFSSFDALSQQHGVEKIKTIGDAYMAVCGLPEERPDHAQVMAGMALDMMKALDAFNASHDTDLRLRVGLNTGPAVAGVIGTHKFIYDLWGDAVNTAARMESHGVPDRVHVSHATYERLVDDFELESRGAIEVKGKGQMHTYLLTGRRAEPARITEMT